MVDIIDFGVSSYWRSSGDGSSWESKFSSKSTTIELLFSIIRRK